MPSKSPTHASPWTRQAKRTDTPARCAGWPPSRRMPRAPTTWEWSLTAAAEALRRDAWAALNPAPPLGRCAHEDGNNGQHTDIAGPSCDVA